MVQTQPKPTRSTYHEFQSGVSSNEEEKPKKNDQVMMVKKKFNSRIRVESPDTQTPTTSGGTGAIRKTTKQPENNQVKALALRSSSTNEFSLNIPEEEEQEETDPMKTDQNEMMKRFKQKIVFTTNQQRAILGRKIEGEAIKNQNTEEKPTQTTNKNDEDAKGEIIINVFLTDNMKITGEINKNEGKNFTIMTQSGEKNPSREAGTQTTKSTDSEVSEDELQNEYRQWCEKQKMKKFEDYKKMREAEKRKGWRTAKWLQEEYEDNQSSEYNPEFPAYNYFQNYRESPKYNPKSPELLSYHGSQASTWNHYDYGKTATATGGHGNSPGTTPDPFERSTEKMDSDGYLTPELRKMEKRRREKNQTGFEFKKKPERENESFGSTPEPYDSEYGGCTSPAQLMREYQERSKNRVGKTGYKPMHKNPIGKLQELCNRVKLDTPIYRITNDTGCKEKRFTILCKIPGTSYWGKGFTGNKKEAKHAAAYDTLRSLPLYA